jgi:hypothetical protein
MCRLAAFPPGFDKEDAIKMMATYGEYNKDGVGIAYVKDGEIVVKKWASSWESLEKNKVDVFAHMPYDGWTIAHVRAATHGLKTMVNTHPFIKGDWAVCHNGIYSGHRVARALLSETGSIFTGETDSEAGAELINKFGPKRFPAFAGEHDGTWLALNKNGELYVVVTGGACDISKIPGTKGQILVASSMTGDNVKTVESGWLRFGSNGRLKNGKYKIEKAYSYTPSSFGRTWTRQDKESLRKQTAYEKEWDKKHPAPKGFTEYDYEKVQERDIYYGSFD